MTEEDVRRCTECDEELTEDEDSQCNLCKAYILSQESERQENQRLIENGGQQPIVVIDGKDYRLVELRFSHVLNKLRELATDRGDGTSGTCFDKPVENWLYTSAVDIVSKTANMKEAERIDYIAEMLSCILHLGLEIGREQALSFDTGLDMVNLAADEEDSFEGTPLGLS